MLAKTNSTLESFGRSFYSPAKDLGNQDFKAWSQQNFYRTSYRDMSKKYPQKEKSYAIPGYSGYIPGTNADNNFGKGFTRTAREQLNRNKYLPPQVTEKFPKRPFSTSVMGRSVGRVGGGLDDEYHTVSRFHGKTTIPMTHPNFSNQTWETTNRATFVNQEQQRARVFRSTDPGFWKSCSVSNRKSAQASGFVQNSTLFDGNGWTPIKQLHGDMTGTEYRNKINPKVTFHPPPFKPNVRKLNKKEVVY